MAPVIAIQGLYKLSIQALGHIIDSQVVKRAFLGNRFYSFLKKIMLWWLLLFYSLKQSLKFSFLSKINPRLYVVPMTGLFPNIKTGCHWIDVWLKKNILNLLETAYVKRSFPLISRVTNKILIIILILKDFAWIIHYGEVSCVIAKCLTLVDRWIQIP